MSGQGLDAQVHIWAPAGDAFFKIAFRVGLILSLDGVQGCKKKRGELSVKTKEYKASALDVDDVQQREGKYIERQQLIR